MSQLAELTPMALKQLTVVTLLTLTQAQLPQTLLYTQRLLVAQTTMLLSLQLGMWGLVQVPLTQT